MIVRCCHRLEVQSYVKSNLWNNFDIFFQMSLLIKLSINQHHQNYQKIRETLSTAYISVIFYIFFVWILEDQMSETRILTHPNVSQIEQCNIKQQKPQIVLHCRSEIIFNTRWSVKLSIRTKTSDSSECNWFYPTKMNSFHETL